VGEAAAEVARHLSAMSEPWEAVCCAEGAAGIVQRPDCCRSRGSSPAPSSPAAPPPADGGPGRPNRLGAPAPLPWQPRLGAQAKESKESVTFSTEAFRLSTGGPEAGAAAPSRSSWRSSYALGRVLGDGISATVYEAEALLDSDAGGPEDAKGCCAQRDTDAHSGTHSCQWDRLGLLLGGCSSILSWPRHEDQFERGRRVAIKRFHRRGTKTFQCELQALQRVGVHPNVLRLLESYRGSDGEDVLVLEYCDGATLYDLYAREHGNGGIPERLIAHLIRQLLLALEHLRSRGVEHQDVKPENMMLFDVSVLHLEGELKLGDFGWAEVSPSGGSSWSGMRRKAPQSGVGSLWYAPPELNPPVEGLPATVGADTTWDATAGKSDMWSVGVVLYLLLVGTNPFNLAREQPNEQAVDLEVLRLAALGEFNRQSDGWRRLHEEARHLVSLLLCAAPQGRPSAVEALRHPFVARRAGRGPEFACRPPRAVALQGGRGAAWSRLDGLQQLGWLAVARAVAEPELDRWVVDSATEAASAAGTPGPYLWQLARELGSCPVGRWLRAREAFAEVVRLAFFYLDLDGDGLLSPQDLVSHIVSVSGGNGSEKARAAAVVMACRWVVRWQDPLSDPAVTDRGYSGLPFGAFQEALLASHEFDDRKLVDAGEGEKQGRPAGATAGGTAKGASAGHAWLPPPAVAHEDLAASRGAPVRRAARAAADGDAEIFGMLVRL